MPVVPRWLEVAVRNIFDQYSQPENRVTHALMSALNEDRQLLASFLRDLLAIEPPTSERRLGVLSQRFPGDPESVESDQQRLGIPDAWIFDDEGWCVVIEAKVTAVLNADQLQRHRRAAARRGFDRIHMLAITAVENPIRSTDLVHLRWCEVYAWLNRQSAKRDWARRTAGYLEIAEARLIDGGQLTEGALTMFTGIPFGPDRPYTYLEGKRLLGLALQELRQRSDLANDMGMLPLHPGRPAITGRDVDIVWDFLSIAESIDGDTFTSSPHLTLGIGRHRSEVMLTIPNAVDRRMRRNLIERGLPGLQDIIAAMLQNYRSLFRTCPGASPRCRGVQRRYPSQRAQPHIDTLIEFDMRTAVPGADGPKCLPGWLEALFSAFQNKQGSNYQIQFGVVFEYHLCPALAERSTLDLFAQGWLGTRPMLDAMRASAPMPPERTKQELAQYGSA